MTFLLKFIMCLLAGSFFGDSIEAAGPAPTQNAQKPAPVQSPNAQQSQDDSDNSDVHEEEYALDDGNPTDQDVMIMEEDEDSQPS